MVKLIFLVVGIICFVYSVQDLNMALSDCEIPSLVIIDCTRSIIIGLIGFFCLGINVLIIFGDNLAEKLDTLGQRS